MTVEIEPVERELVIVRLETLGGVVVAVRVGIQRGVPEKATVRLVHEGTSGESDAGDGVVVASWSGVDCVSAVAGVCVWTLALFLKACVGEGLAGRVLAVPDGLGSAVFEADHVVFPVLFSIWPVYSGLLVGGVELGLPVSNMVPEFHAQHRVSLVVSVPFVRVACSVP